MTDPDAIANRAGTPVLAVVPDPGGGQHTAVGARRAQAAILDIAGMQTAFGLSWRRLKGYASPDREARAEARRLGAAAIAVRPQKRHFGFARDLDLPRVRRVRVAAAAVADAFPHTMMGAWPLPDGRWWCVALERGEVYPMFGDLLLPDVAAARRWFDERRPENDWSTLAVPAEWDPERASRESLEQLLSANVGATLEPIRGALPGTPARIATGVALLAVAGIAAMWLLSPTQRPKRPPTPPPAAAAPPPAPQIVPSPATVAAVCTRLLETVSPALPSAGWTGTRAACAADFAALEVGLTATVRPLTPEVPGLLPIRLDGAIVDFAKGEAVIERTIPLPLVGRVPPATPPAAAALSQHLISAAARTGARLSVDPTGLLPGQTLLRWTADGIVYLPNLIKVLNVIPGIRVTGMDLDLTSFTWTLTGEANVSPNT